MGAVMKVGLVVDAAVDLPAGYLAQKGIHVLPIGLRVGEESLVDQRDPSQTVRFLAGSDDKRAEMHAESIPLSVEQIEQRMLGGWVTDYDHLLCVTTMAGRSAIFAHTTEAVLKVGRAARSRRVEAGLNPGWGASVIDGRTLFAGPGVVAYEAVRLREAGMPLDAISARLKDVADCTHAFMVADDLYYILRRAAKKGDHSVNWATYAVGSVLRIKPILHAHRDNTGPIGKARGFRSGVVALFDRVIAQIERGLEVPCVNISFGGPVAKVPGLPGYARLLERARQAGVEVLVSHMSMTAAINVGAGALCVAFAARDHQV
jgi:fatty acid-binding protein DegV